MSNFHFYHPIEVRYGDLDPQGHLNNAKFVTFFEQARIQYIRHLGLYKEGQSFMEIGVILADVHVAYKKPVEWGTPVKVGVRTMKIGNKSMTVEQNVVHAETGEVYATGEVVMVAYDYYAGKSIPVPQDWRDAAQQFEDLPKG
ncbi:MAG: thioesterase family protein [Chloroflexota bacterium]